MPLFAQAPDQPRRHSPEDATRPAIFVTRHRYVPAKWADQEPNCPPTTRSIAPPHLQPLSGATQIPIARGTAYAPSSRFPPLEVFVRRPPEYAARHACGRHPKTFTRGDIDRLPPFGRTGALGRGGKWCRCPVVTDL